MRLFLMMNLYNCDVTKYGRCKIDDLLFEMLYDSHFESIFILKRLC